MDFIILFYVILVIDKMVQPVSRSYSFIKERRLIRSEIAFLKDHHFILPFLSIMNTFEIDLDSKTA